MAIDAVFMDMRLVVRDGDQPNLDFFAHCRQHVLHLQSCGRCDLMRYPPMPACPFCGAEENHWLPVDAKGQVYSYTEVHHATHSAFKSCVPYAVAIVELDAQCDRPHPGAALRIPAVVVQADGAIASPATGVGIGTRMRMIFTDANDVMAIPRWTIDTDGNPGTPPSTCP